MRRVPLLEVIAASVFDAMAAEQAGAQRLELVQALSEGGLTPSVGLVRAVQRAVRIPVMVMLRPRGGDFSYSQHEISVLRDDLAIFKELGVAGVVFGVLGAHAQVDVPLLHELVTAARPLLVTFHRAFDATLEPYEALEALVAAGVDRVLSSGQATDAGAGAELLRRLVDQAGNRIVVMPGAGITPSNAQDIARRTGASEFHASCSAARPHDGLRVVDADRVAAVWRGLVAGTEQKRG